MLPPASTRAALTLVPPKSTPRVKDGIAPPSERPYLLESDLVTSRFFGSSFDRLMGLSFLL
jgi:hypothetical protein